MTSSKKLLILFYAVLFTFIPSVFADGDFSVHEKEILRITITISATLGAIGAIFIILSFLFVKELRNFIGIIVFNLSIANLLTSIAFLMSNFPIDNNKVLCDVQGFVDQWFSLSGLFWVGCVAYSLFVIVVKEQRNTWYLLKYYFIISWFFPLATAIGMLMGDHYRNTGIWCWIQNSELYYRFFLWYIFLFGDFIFTIIIMITIVRKVRIVAIASGRSQYSIDIATNIALKRTRNYILVFLISYSFGVINRIQNFISPDSPNFWLTLLQGAMFPLQGLLNGVVYGFNNFETIRLIIVRQLSKSGAMPSNAAVQEYKLFQEQKNPLLSKVSISSTSISRSTNDTYDNRNY